MPSNENSSETDSIIAVRHWLHRHQSGDEQAKTELLNVSMRRLRLLARRIILDIPKVRSVEETDDLLQSSVVRLWKYLLESSPASPVDYFRLAACMIRRELIDLSRRHFRSEVERTDNGSKDRVFEVEPDNECVGSDPETFDPQRLAQWTEFHEYIERLPDEDRVLFDLLWYQGLTMDETSVLLAIPLRTLGRRWKLVRVRLYRELLSEEDGGSYSA